MSPSSDLSSRPALAAGRDESALRLDGVTKRFGGLVAVDGVSLVLPPGGRIAVIGPNGAGKTTLFRIIAGEMSLSGGRIHHFGDDVTRVSERGRALRGIGRTFQVSNLFDGLSVVDNVRLAVQAGTGRGLSFWRGLPDRDDFGGRAHETLEQVGLGARVRDHVGDLSHGEQRQLEIAMALVRRPKLLLLDEPAAGLSASERGMLRELLATIPSDVSFLLIEHDMSLALELSNAVLCLDNGVPLAYGTPDEIRANPAVQAVYLGRRE